MTRSWQRVLAYGMLPALALLLALAAGGLKWCESSSRAVDRARVESVEAAADATVAILSFSVDTVEQDMASAQRWLTDGYRDRFAQKVRDPVIRDAKARGVSSAVDVAGVGSVSARPNHAVVLVFVDQSLTIGSGESTEIASSYRVTLDKVDGYWRVAKFDVV